MIATRLFREFSQSEKSGGIILIFCTAASLLLANFIIGEDYAEFWHRKVGFSIGSFEMYLSIEHWINDGLMTIFFLLIGLEIERELNVGELSDLKNATLPIFAAIGGLAVPALIHFALNRATPAENGFGIPMATDIAFALGILSLAGKRVPLALKVFLTALAIIDDLAAILVIAVFYTSELHSTYLFIALGIFCLLMILKRLKVYSLVPYLLGGLVMWYCMLQSGVHATITGVLLAFAIPFRNGGEESPSWRLQHFLHLPVAFFIVPVFALANTGIILSGSLRSILTDSNSLGIIAGLLIGKPVGILFMCLLAVKFKLGRLPEGVNWLQLAAAGMLAGIGFTMSIFITLLAFGDAVMVLYSKVAILLASLAAGIIGFILLKRAVRDNPVMTE